MRDLPSGTVTFLFTDVEGSTKLLHELGADDYAHALAEHRRILREAFGAHGGGGSEASYELIGVKPDEPIHASGAAQSLELMLAGIF